MAFGANSILVHYGWLKDMINEESAKEAREIKLDFLEAHLYNLLLQGDMTITGLIEHSDAQVHSIMGALSVLEMEELIEKMPGNHYRAIR